MVKIAKYIDPRLVLFPEVATRDDVIRALVDAAHRAEKVSDVPTFFDAIINREKVVTTGIGMGVAIPHAKLPTFQDFFMAIAVLKKGVDWKALDNAPVRMIFMIGGPDDKPTEYLQILSGLTAALREDSRRKGILSTTSPDELIRIFETF